MIGRVGRRVLAVAIFLASLVGAPMSALAIGSYLALLPGLACAGTFVYRTWCEDRFLHEDLMGYAEYASRTRHRLLPGVW